MIQRKFLTIGLEGCYFFCLWELINRTNSSSYHDPLILYDRCVEKGYLGKDCWVYEPALILELGTGKKWGFRKEEGGYERRANEFAILRYERKLPSGAMSHFVLLNDDGTIWDPMGESETVRLGIVESQRVFWIRG